MEQYQAMDPLEASRRCGIPYDEETKCFTVRLLQKEYRVSWPDFEVHSTDPDNTDYAALEKQKQQEEAEHRMLRRFGRGRREKDKGR